MKRLAVLNSNTLKIIAAITMLIDHVGVVLFPQYEIFRIIGRISFPIYAFMIAEGCRRTRNKLKHFLMIFGLGVICQVVFQMATGVEYMGILITFSASIILINLLLDFKKQVYHGKWYFAALTGLLFALLVVLAVIITQRVEFDYGIIGILCPPLLTVPSIADRGDGKPGIVARIIDSNVTRVLLLAACMIGIAFSTRETLPLYSLLSVPLLLMYSGKRGKLKLKWFFYVFYPVHLVVIAGIEYLISRTA